METQRLYQQAMTFATSKHEEKSQKIPGTALPYNVHLSNVAMEILIASAHSADFHLGFAVQVALLHDTLEDTSTSIEELQSLFGVDIAMAVEALSKNSALPKSQQMQDSLARIKKQPKEIWAVKLADRITNLQKPPSHWSKDKKISYQAEARHILAELGPGNDYLAQRLAQMIEAYSIYLAD